jgi:ABC-type multidrug transport system permease subunit
MYSVSAYYLAKIIIEVPVLSFIPILFSVMVYFKIGLTITASQFFYFYLILLLISHSAASFGYFISSIFNKEEMAIALAPIVMMPIILFGGQFANSDNIQAWISWFQYISPIRYGFESFTRNEFDNRVYNTTAIIMNVTSGATFGKSFDDLKAMRNSGNFNISDFKVIQQPEVNPTEVSGFDVGLWQSLVILAALTVGLRFISYFFLRLFVSKFQ